MRRARGQLILNRTIKLRCRKETVRLLRRRNVSFASTLLYTADGAL